LNKWREQDAQQLIFAINQAYNSLMRIFQNLKQMGLKPTLQTPEALWHSLCVRFGNRSRLKIPHLLILDQNGLREELAEKINFGSKKHPKHTRTVQSVMGDQIHATSRLLYSGVPYADRKWVCLPVAKGKTKYVGVLVLEEKPEGFLGDKGQLLHLWDIFSREGIYDIEAITEITPADTSLVRAALQLHTRNNISKQEQAQDKGTVEVSAQLNGEASIEAQARLYKGDVPLYTSVVVLVYRDSPEKLSDACRYISGLFPQPAKLGRETEYAWFVWLQTLGLRKEPLLSTPYFRRLLFFASELSGLCNPVKVAQGDKQGFELLAQDGGAPVFIDFSRHKNVLVLGTTGSGKSVLIASILALCIALGMPCIIVDIPNADGIGTYYDFTLFYNGFYFDISKESNNLVQPPNLSHITNEEERKGRLEDHRNDLILIVNRLVLGSNSLDGFLVETIESLIPLGIKSFYEDEAIKSRFENARKGGLGSQEWGNTPTLRDLIDFYSPTYINLGYKDENQEKALNHIRLRLNYWLASAIGKAIGKPSTFDLESSKCPIITFALTNLNSEKEAEIFALSAYLAAKRQTLSASNSVFFIDEASVLLRYLSLSLTIGRLCATARKSGCRILLAGQDLQSIAESAAGTQIIENMACRLIGRTVPGAARKYQEYLQIPEEIITQNESFESNNEGYTRWLMDYNNTYIHCRYYPSYPMLALTANNREEQAIREQFQAQYPNKFQWLTEFYRYYKQYLQREK
jgi:Helicase HerA, central domain